MFVAFDNPWVKSQGLHVSSWPDCRLGTRCERRGRTETGGHELILVDATDDVIIAADIRLKFGVRCRVREF